MTKRYRVNFQRNVGNVIFILEGAKTEFQLLTRIFVKLLGYELHRLPRTHMEGFTLQGSNPHSRIMGINCRGNRLFETDPDELDLLFFRIRTELGIKPENAAIYYLYDRDVKSYGPDEVRPYVEKYRDPFGTDEGDQGQLLLSYPAVESYTVSCFCDHTCALAFELGRDLKTYAAQHTYTIQMIKGPKQLTHATVELDTALEALGLGGYDLDALGGTILELYDAQQRTYLQCGAFPLVSTLSLALLELGILEEAEEV